MQTKKIFEFTCQCALYRNDIKIQVKGEKGKLRKVVLNLIEQYPPQQAPPLPIKCKQPTLEQLFQRQQNNQKPKETIKPISIKMNLIIYCNGDPLFDFNLDQIKLNSQVNMKQKSFQLHYQDKLISFFDCSPEILLNFQEHILNLQQQYRKFQNQVQSKPEPITIQQTPENDITSSQEIRKQPLNQMQMAKMQRKRMAEQQETINSVQIIKQQKQQNIETKKNETTKFKIFLPNSIIYQILQFINIKLLYRLRLVNKQFEQLINKQVSTISFKKYYEVPIEVVLRIMNKFQNVKSLSFGCLKNIKSSQFGEQTIPKLQNLEKLDLSDLQYLNDKVCAKFLCQFDNLVKLSLPYNSKISSDIIQMIVQRLPKVREIKLKEKDKNQLNEQITPQSFVSLFEKRKLTYLSIPTIQIEYFSHFSTQLQKELIKFDIQGKMKFGSIVFTQLNPKQIESFNQFLGWNKQITKLSVQHVQIKNQNLKWSTLFNEDSFIQLSNFPSVSFGSFVDNEFCLNLAKYHADIKQLKIRSKLITDEGLKVIFQKCKQLELIDVAYCSLINGHGFEYLEDKALSLEFPKIEIGVSFDDYNLSCLEGLLQRKAYEYKINNLGIRKK